MLRSQKAASSAHRGRGSRSIDDFTEGFVKVTHMGLRLPTGSVIIGAG